MYKIQHTPGLEHDSNTNRSLATDKSIRNRADKMTATNFATPKIGDCEQFFILSIGSKKNEEAGCVESLQIIGFRQELPNHGQGVVSQVEY